MMSWYGGPGWGGWIVMTLMMLAFWALVIFGGMALFRGVRPSGDRSPSGSGQGQSSAERLLEERFARGEIDAEEFIRRRDVLRSGGRP